jgi:hypothetical protein
MGRAAAKFARLRGRSGFSASLLASCCVYTDGRAGTPAAPPILTAAVKGLATEKLERFWNYPPEKLRRGRINPTVLAAKSRRGPIFL